MTDKEKRLTAYHESGHAIATAFLEGQDPVHEVSIIPRGMAGGYTMALPKEDRAYKLRGDMLDDLVVLLGGRVSEALVLGDISTGASNDIERATNIARDMVMRYGMSSKIGPISYTSGSHEIFLGRDYGATSAYSESVATEIDLEVSGMLKEAYRRCEEILNAHMDKLHELASYLIVHEKINEADFTKLIEGTLNEETAADPGKEEPEEATE